MADFEKNRLKRFNTLMLRWNRQVALQTLVLKKIKLIAQFLAIILTRKIDLQDKFDAVCYVNRAEHLEYFKRYLDDDQSNALFVVPFHHKLFTANRKKISIGELISSKDLIRALLQFDFDFELAIIFCIYNSIKKMRPKKFITACVVGKPIVISRALRGSITTVGLVISDLPYDSKLFKAYNWYSPDIIVNFSCKVMVPNFKSNECINFRTRDFHVLDGNSRDVFISQPLLKLRVCNLAQIDAFARMIYEDSVSTIHLKFHPREPVWERCIKVFIFRKYFKVRITGSKFHRCDRVYGYSSTLLTDLENCDLNVKWLTP